MARPLHTIIPVRFLSLSAHLAILVMCLYDRDGNIRACLPTQYTSSQYNDKDNRFIVGLAFSLGFLVVEFFGFLFGFSMFRAAISLLLYEAIALHFSGAVSLLFYRINDWACDRFWAIFATCGAVPALLEVLVIIYMIKYRR